MTIEEVKALLELAKANGALEVTIEGTTFTLSQTKPITDSGVASTHLNAQPQQHVPDQTAEELVKPLSMFDEPSEEEVLYYATPYYDVLMTQKAEQAEHAKESRSLKEPSK